MDDAGDPGPCRATTNQCHSDRAEDRSVMWALENLDNNWAHHGCQRVAEEALSKHHHVEHGGRWSILQRDQRRIADSEARTSARPHPFPADAIRQAAEDDLSRDAEYTHCAKRPGGNKRCEANLGEVLRLMHLHGV